MTRLCARCLLALGLWGMLTFASAQGLLPVPALSARVIDQTGTLDAASIASMEAKLAAFEQFNGSQVVVLMVPTPAPEDIADFTQRVGDAWKIGRADVGDGALFVIAKDDRRLRIATAKALEG
ncbi:MAG: TPM domain-containing protein, partial [Hydrogenophaga sp.]|nr:TPM domain-containing protein [Hydrogenophaga sp.]